MSGDHRVSVSAPPHLVVVVVVVGLVFVLGFRGRLEGHGGRAGHLRGGLAALILGLQVPSGGNERVDDLLVVKLVRPEQGAPAVRGAHQRVAGVLGDGAQHSLDVPVRDVLPRLTLDVVVVEARPVVRLDRR